MSVFRVLRPVIYSFVLKKSPVDRNQLNNESPKLQHLLLFPGLSWFSLRFWVVSELYRMINTHTTYCSFSKARLLISLLVCLFRLRALYLFSHQQQLSYYIYATRFAKLNLLLIQYACSNEHKDAFRCHSTTYDSGNKSLTNSHCLFINEVAACIQI
jgi:hypothetical protein